MIDTTRNWLFIASEVRSGSTYIAESLAYELDINFGFKMWGLTKEHFSSLDEHSTADDVVKILSGLYLDTCGFATAKVMCKALSVIHRLARLSEDVNRAFFGEMTRWVVVRRRDRLKQAVSLAMAIKTGTYHFYGDPSDAPDRGTKLSNLEIESALRAVTLSDIYLDAFTATLPECRVVSCFYEDFMADEVSWLNRVHAMCGFPFIKRELYVNKAKLKPTATEAKRLAYEEFRQWFLMNYV